MKYLHSKKFKEIMTLSLQKLKRRGPLNEVDKPAVKKSNRFDGLSEEEVQKNFLQDILKDDLDLVFLGINPSLMAAHTGRYYAGPGNHFYKLLYESKLVPEYISYEQDHELLKYKIGLTNIVARATRSSADLSKSELKKGAMIVHQKLKHFRPKVAVFNGKCIYEEFDDKYDKATFRFGLQPHRVGDTALWVVPSSSARCANFPRMQDKLHFYTSLKKYLSFLKGEIKEVNLEEFSFEGKCKQAVPATSKMWRRKGKSMFANGGKIVNKETINMDTSEENILNIPRSNEFIIKNIQPNENNDLEKDSGISTSQSDNSQELSQGSEIENIENDGIQENNSQTKKRQQNKLVSQRSIQTRSTMNALNKERTETIDFVNLIKQRISNRGVIENKNEEENFNKDETQVQTNVNAKGLKFGNLCSKKYKSGFKVKKN